MARLLPNGRPAGPMSQSRLALAKNIRENAFANNEFSSPAPTKDTRINANLRGANFITPDVGEISRQLIGWEDLKGAYNNPLETLKGAGKLALVTSAPQTAAALLGPKESLSTLTGQSPDVRYATAIGGLIPGGQGEAGAARLARSIFELESPFVARHLVKPITEHLPGEIGGDLAKENAMIDALARQTEAQAKKQGIKLSDVPRTMRERATGKVWDTHTLNPNGTYTIELTGTHLDRQGIKEHAFKTLMDGYNRQIAHGFEPDEIPYKTASDIPDEFVDRILTDYPGYHRVADARGRDMPHLGLTLDHVKSLKTGGANTLENLVGSLGRFNSKMGAKE